jgi:hypothetical protein
MNLTPVELEGLRVITKAHLGELHHARGYQGVADGELRRQIDLYEGVLTKIKNALAGK